MRTWLAALWNVLTVIFLLATLGVVGWGVLIYRDPQTGLNPFPPGALPDVLALPTPDPLLALPSPTIQPSDTPEPTFTPTSEPPTPTLTPEFTVVTLVAITPSNTPRPTAGPGSYAFIPAEGSPAAISYSLYSDQGCNFSGIAGRVIGLDGNPVTPGVVVRLSGRLEGRLVSIDTLSGTAQEFGDSGFSFQIADRPVSSRGTLFVQLLDQSYLPLSARLGIDTFDNCEQNLIFISFQQVR